MISPGKTFFSVLLIILLTALPLKASEKQIWLRGRTMGTTYHITALAPANTDRAVLEKKIQVQLSMISRSMSTFSKKSEITRFNTHNCSEAFHASGDFFKVMQASKKIHSLTGGAWDGTVNPLVELWGFGKKDTIFSVPRQSEIDNALSKTGFDKIEFIEPGILKKRNKALTVDLASIAKGYGVDKTASLLRNSGIRNCVVEIGGEVICLGRKKDDRPWTVGISDPRPGSGDLYRTVELVDMAMATSGDYRNFREIDGRRYSHIINPETGWPVTNDVVSATVTSKSCMTADGLATAIMVMGKKRGIQLVETIEDTECLVVVRKDDGTFAEHVSKGFGRK